ncbi:diguanylate cyclase [Halarcobacter ebronensis]|uniref:diguanylate cyclase n=1 Tax=Halarcobacter ebronensis TaxID=1462615 RepID=A0A4Q1AHS4_9BACT|nr:diguanylate cyclase [Halarcobacter ebronensis]QKF82185.1 multi-sensor domain-containing diguanylate cyclase [Halarcobacter ebronensis]RXK03437.1 hypothetical protein CRV07_12210 [Halarcobacter ebronensis]
MGKKEIVNRVFLFVLFIVCEAGLILQIDKYYDDKKEELLKQNISNIEAQFRIVNKNLTELADSSFRGFIDREEILEVFAKRDREALFNLLKTDYLYLSSLGFKQIDFHLPNNISFLRMHRPEKFGDDLSSFRYTVEYTNRLQKGINGFEIGRVLPGIRNLFPLFFKGEYIGSVELSFGLDKFENEIEKVYGIYTHSLIKKSDFDKMVFLEEKQNYKLSAENSDYVELKEDEGRDFFNKITFNKEFYERVAKGLKSQKFFNLELPNEHYIVSFLPIVSPKGESIIYFVFYEKSQDLKLFEEHRHDRTVLFSLILIVVFFLLYQLMKIQELTLRSKKDIEKEKSRYKDLMNLASDGIHILDKNGNIYESNQAFANMLGYTYEEVLKLNIKDFDTNNYNPKEVEIKIDKAEVFNVKHKRKDGTTFDAQINAKWIQLEGEEYLYSSSRDITQERNAYKKLQKFIDLQDNIVVVSDSIEINYANKKFFIFLGFKSLEDFKKKFNCICDLFVQNDRFFHLGKIENGENWIEHLEKIPHSKRIVGMLMYDYTIHAFAVTVNKFEDGYYILTFTDITQTMLKHIELEDKTIHDKLTNALNREYFEQNYKLLIKNFTQNSSKLGLAFIDIDHFKSVNDTFGHDVGDIVLMDFVKTVQKYSRENDILIRWGGEEFVFIFKTDSLNGLIKALEHIRVVVELEEFKVVKHITCSIGATLYIEDESIEQTIKRADEAVYKAKKAGRNRLEIVN